jgi:transcription factor SPN1
MSDQEEPQSATSSDEESEKRVVNNESESEDHEQDEIAEMLTKKKKRSAPRRFEIGEDDENMVDLLLTDMGTAADDDIKANQDSLPALNKLKMLDKVLKFLKVSKYHETFLTMNGCVVLGRWLSQLPDGSFPSTPLRTGLLQAIQDIPISIENLQTSDLGKSIMAIYNNPNETINIKKLAKNLIDKWSRMIYEINTEYTALHRNDQGVEEFSLPKKKISLQNLISQDTQTNYTKLPERGLFNFKKRPLPETISSDNIQQFNSDSTYSKLKKKMQKKKGNSKLKGLMSVDGKGLDF